MIDLEVADHLFDLRQGTAITSRDSLAQRHRLANHLQVRAAGTTILRRLRFCAALRTEHVFETCDRPVWFRVTNGGGKPLFLTCSMSDVTECRLVQQT